MRGLKIGSTGQDVNRVQQFLAFRRLYLGEVDGRYGPATASAVTAYQRLHNLIPDGVIGNQTLAAMIHENLDAVLDVDQEVPPAPDWLKPIFDNEGRMRKWGRFTYRPAPQPDNPEAIEITSDFEAKNIAPVFCPILGVQVRLHRSVHEDYLAFMSAIIAAGLEKRILTDDGAFVPRFMRGSRSKLSNHAWGTAFDRNADWNALGCTPAYIGQPGSLREIVAIGNKHNWFWGGHFKQRRDGMHFEHV
jgi:Putative peptidoglycan binding domain/D-alanyl-D-alanine carboxypeptidase